MFQKIFQRVASRLLPSLAKHRDLLTATLRFTDVLPSLKSADDINEHLKDYLSRVQAPIHFRLAIEFLFSLPKSLQAKLITSFTNSFARQFIAGETFKDVRQSSGLILDLLGELVVSEKEALFYQQAYLQLIEDAQHQTENLQISLKLSCLTPHWNPLDFEGTCRRVKANLIPILHRIRSSPQNIGLTIDMEQHEYQELTYFIFKRIFAEKPFNQMAQIGIVVQSYLKISPAILEDLAHWVKNERHLPILIRLVKGAYYDQEKIISAQKGYDLPVFEEKWQTDHNFKKLADIILDRPESFIPAFASHNADSLQHGIDRALYLRRPFQIQMLYGMAEELRQKMQNHDLWIYTPLGKLLPGMAYLARRILENTSQSSVLMAGKNLEGEHKVRPYPLPSTIYHSPFTNEPLTDFSQKKNQEKIQEALITINASESRQNYSVFIPKIVKTTHDYYHIWSLFPVKQRSSYLKRTAAILRQNRIPLTALIMKEGLKTIREADADIAEAIDFLEYYAHQALKIEYPLPQGERVRVRGVGVAAIIAPWNFPLAILTGMSAAALVMGNTVIMKPAEETPAIGQALYQAYLDAGIPPEAIQIIQGDGQVGQALLRSPEIKLVAFTGSREVGIRIYEQMAPSGVRVIAEMGGKNALIVDDDAHIDEVITTVLQAKWGYAGQKCSALDRLIIVGDRYPQIVSRLIEAASELEVGPIEHFGNFYGPIISNEAYNRLVSLIGEGERQARLLLDGRLKKNDHLRLLPPTIFEVTDPTVSIFNEEIFGPILTVMKAATLEQAVHIARTSQYQLTGGLLTRSPSHQKYVEETWVEVGNLYINRPQTGAVVGRQPFGGNGLSGIGGTKAGGEQYLWWFTEKTTNGWRATGDPQNLLSTNFGEGAGQDPFVGFLKNNYQPNLPGETNTVIYRPRGPGIIILNNALSDAECIQFMTLANYAKCHFSLIAKDHMSVNLIKWLSKHKHSLTHLKHIYDALSDSRIIDKIKEATWVVVRDDKHLAQAVVKTDQNFVRLLIQGDPKDRATQLSFLYPQTVTVNTSRHGYIFTGSS